MADTPTWFPPNAAFERVVVDYLTRGSARITWHLNRHMVDGGPYYFLLQGSQGQGATTADDWADVGVEQADVGQLVDLTEQMFGKTSTLTYRVRLRTSTGLYYSDVASVLGKYTKRDWLYATEVIRKETLRHQLFSSIPGWLLKAKRYGTVCPCVDPFTGEVTSSTCPQCYGTGFLTGYYAPVPYTFCEVQPITSREHRDFQMQGTDKKVTTMGRFIGLPELIQGDAFVCDGSDKRYYLHTLTEKATWKGVPLVSEAEMRLAPFTDKLYDVALPPDYPQGV